MDHGSASSIPTSMCWNPSSPYSMVLRVRGEEDFKVALSANGLGCTPEEATALVQLLDAREESHKKNDESDGLDDSVLPLAQRYLQIVHECIEAWSDRLDDEANAKKENVDDDGNVDDDVETETYNLHYLQKVHAILHLSCVFLLSDQFVVADAVRCLRQHFCDDDDDDEDDDEIFDLDVILESPEPEHHQGYWSLVEGMVRKGQLHDAWSVLAQHSSCRRLGASAANNAMNDQDDDESLTMRREWSRIYALLCAAPIPGADENETTDYSSNNNNQQKQSFVSTNLLLLEGVPPFSHRLWENAETAPMALSRWMVWKAAVHEMESTSFSKLLSTVPRLRHVLRILMGEDEGGNKKGGWAHQLLQILLYVRPSVTVERLCVEASSLLDRNQEMQCIVLAIMRGNAGRAVEAIHSLGGGSGAALPSTLTALLCDLLHGAGRLSLAPSHNNNNSNNNQTVVDLRLELTLAAAAACRSSFAVLSADRERKHGIICALRLLRGTREVRGCATVAQMVSSLDQSELTDAEAEVLLALCGKTTSSQQIHSHSVDRLRQEGYLRDARVDLCLGRADYYLRRSQPGGAAYWCALAFRSTTTNNNNNSSNNNYDQESDIARRPHRFLEQRLCRSATLPLVRVLRGLTKVSFLDYTTNTDAIQAALEAHDTFFRAVVDYGAEILRGLERGAAGDGGGDHPYGYGLQFLSNDPPSRASVRTLRHAVNLLQCLIDGKDPSEALAAAAIDLCTTTHHNKSSRSHHQWSFLPALACVYQNETKDQGSSSTLDVEGIHALLSSSAFPEGDDQQRIRETLMVGFKDAVVRENDCIDKSTETVDSPTEGMATTLRRLRRLPPVVL